jgi:hypothetical protein
MKRLSKYVEALRLGAVIDSKAPAGGAAAGQTVILPVYETIQVLGLGASSASLSAFVNDNVSGQYVIAGVTATFGTASSSGTLQVEVATGTQATGSGTNQLTGTVSLAGTANTPVNGTLIAAPTTIAAGSRVNVILGGTLTGLANGAIAIVLQRVA